MSIFKKIIGDANERYLKKIRPQVASINDLEPKFERFSDEKLKEKTGQLKQSLKHQSLDDILVEAFVMTREAAKRTLGQRHFDVQIMGGIAMHQGKIVQMLTGEGKTLAATLPVYLNALEGRGVHIVTVNDYLSRRDTVWMGQIYYSLGLSCGCLNHEQAFLYDPEYKKPDQEKDRIRDELGGFRVVEDFLRPCSRKEAYLADITYGTNNEFGFDYLRDNMALDLGGLAQRDLNFAILDEIDSILIDESRTPLIISAPDTEAAYLYKSFAKIMPSLRKDRDYEVDEKLKIVTLTEKGIEKIENILKVGNIYAQKGVDYLHHLEQALKAKELFKKDRDYIVKGGKVVIVDEFTGRLMPGRRWSGGLHQAVEAQEGVGVQPESQTLSTITFQNYFRLYEKLAGMTGTAMTSAEEFDKVYGLDVVCIPCNKPMIRKGLPDRVYRTKTGKFKALIEEVKKRHVKGQPILLGTRSIEKNEYLSQLLEREGIACQVLNAKHHEKEAQIIVQAGKLGAVTVATNMAGRGVDIVLGGYPPSKSEILPRTETKSLVRGRNLSEPASSSGKGSPSRRPKSETKKEEDSYAEWEEEHKKVVALGGLHVMGTERHEARRIDDQLRGRAGRQGDPGSSQFFLCLEDELLRVFGGEGVERVGALMEKTSFPEIQPIESGLLSRAIEKAQEKIEGMHFDARKNLLDYDDVMTRHRDVFYKKRAEILRASPEQLEKLLLNIWKNQGLSTGEFWERANLLGKEKFLSLARLLSLRAFDFYWVCHLEDMLWLRESVRLQAFSRSNPLVEYKTQGFNIFQEMMVEIDSSIARALSKIEVVQKPVLASPGLEVQPTKSPGEARPGTERPGRNDPCPCGATHPDGRPKKYKHCCWPR